MEQIISKQEVDHLFSLTKSQWQTESVKFVAPSSVGKTTESTSGNLVAAYDPSTGIGRFTQPLYPNENEPPALVIMGFYYPPGSLPPMTAELQKDIETQVQTELGDDYSVQLRYSKTEDHECIELQLKQGQHESTWSRIQNIMQKGATEQQQPPKKKKDTLH